MAKHSVGVFVGQHLVRVEPQGRCRLPVEWRTLLLPAGADRFVLTPGLERYITLMSERDYRAECRAVRRLERRGVPGRYYGTMTVLRAERRALDAAERVKLDARGRFTIPAPMRRMAELDRQILLVGALETAEIWSPRRFEDLMKAYRPTEVMREVGFT